MKLSIRGILLLGSVLLLPVVLILNFFVYQKSQEETYIQAIEKKVHAVEIAFNQDFELFQRQGGNPDSLSFARVSGGLFPIHFSLLIHRKSCCIGQAMSLSWILLPWIWRANFKFWIRPTVLFW
jgi:hypothetical protein